jgi:MOSC domain-containing protein YiiM
MQIISTNIGNPSTVTWNGKEYLTGIFKNPVSCPIFLDKDDVDKDSVIDRKYHGGNDKACYIFSEKHYQYWKNLYPNLNWNWGMFGENLTISDLDESQIYVGDLYKVGEAVVQISQPRQPCFKLGIRFNTQQMLKQFIDYGYSGVYIKVVEKGNVKVNDKFELIKKEENSLSIKEIFHLIYLEDKSDNSQVIKALDISSLAASCKNDLKKHWNIDFNP